MASVGFRDKCCRFSANDGGGMQWLETASHRDFGMYWLGFSIDPTQTLALNPRALQDYCQWELSKPDLQECPILHTVTS
jgi:hypothetical protein